ncbi:MAG: hypothetical protein RRA15_13155, partial [bacterium]|nr:hypothetical protein [bacterium]
MSSEGIRILCLWNKEGGIGEVQKDRIEKIEEKQQMHSSYSLFPLPPSSSQSNIKNGFMSSFRILILIESQKVQSGTFR